MPFALKLLRVDMFLNALEVDEVNDGIGCDDVNDNGIEYFRKSVWGGDKSDESGLNSNSLL